MNYSIINSSRLFTCLNRILIAQKCFLGPYIAFLHSNYMLNDYIQRSLSVAKSNKSIILFKLFIEEILQADVRITTKRDLLNALDIGFSTFYPEMAISMIEENELLLDNMIEEGILVLNQEGCNIVPFTTEERLKFHLEKFEFRKFLSFLMKFTNKRAKQQLVRSVKSIEEKNSLLLEFYAFLSYNYALFLHEKEIETPIYPNLDEINLISINVFERAYDLEKEYIVCSNVMELEKNYFACIKLLVDGYFGK